MPILKRLTCLARGHQWVRFIDRLSNIRPDGFGGVQAAVKSWHIECSRCRRHFQRGAAPGESVHLDTTDFKD